MVDTCLCRRPEADRCRNADTEAPRGRCRISLPHHWLSPAPSHGEVAGVTAAPVPIDGFRTVRPALGGESETGIGGSRTVTRGPCALHFFLPGPGNATDPPCDAVGARRPRVKRQTLPVESDKRGNASLNANNCGQALFRKEPSSCYGGKPLFTGKLTLGISGGQGNYHGSSTMSIIRKSPAVRPAIHKS